MQKYRSNITTTTGAAIRNVPVTVLAEGGELAAIFLDRAGAVAASNPLETDSQGAFYFYAVNGRYSLRTTVEGVTITDDDVVLMNDPEELTTAGPIAEAVAAAQAAAQQAKDAVEDSGIPDLVAAAQNAVVDANSAVEQAQSAASLADAAKNESAAAKLAAENAQSGSQSALTQAVQAKSDAQIAAEAAAASAVSVDPAYLLNRENHSGSQDISTILGLQDAIDEKANGTDIGAALALKADKILVAEAIAMAQTFTSVPTTFQAWVIHVTEPHWREFVWSGTEYVRAPWHRPGRIVHYDCPPANVTDAIQLRNDVLYETAKYPDLAKLYGFTGATFSLKDARSRVVRGADNGRNIDTTLVNGYLQDDAGRNLTAYFEGRTTDGTAAIFGNLNGAAQGMYASAGGQIAGNGGSATDRFIAVDINASRVWPTAAEFRVKSYVATNYLTI